MWLQVNDVITPSSHLEEGGMPVSQTITLEGEKCYLSN